MFDHIEKNHTDIPRGVLVEGERIGLIATNSDDSSLLYYLWSTDGIRFERDPQSIIIKKGSRKENPEFCRKFHISYTSRGYIMSYIRSTQVETKHILARSDDMYQWTVVREVSAANTDFVITSETDENQPVLMYGGRPFIQCWSSDDAISWYDHDRYVATSRHDRYDENDITLMGSFVTERGIAVVYDASVEGTENYTLRAGAFIADKNDPRRIIWRGESPLMSAEVDARKHASCVALGAASFGDAIYFYWAFDDDEVLVAKSSPFGRIQHLIRPQRVYLQRHPSNPVITPHDGNEWETEAVFNPAALHMGGKVHMLYRAIGRSGISVLGYSASTDGIHFGERQDTPAYFPRENFEGVHVRGPATYRDIFASGGGWGGCEDPKLTFIDNKVYLTYVAFNGWSPPRVAMSSISKKNFLSNKWKWDMPKLISRPHEVNKSGCILPEKVRGKYVVFHRVFPNILIDYVDSLDDLGKKNNWLKGEFKIEPRPNMWDSRKLSVGATPIKTDVGWLVIYHAVDDRDDSQYKIGAMILDLENPHKVLYRTHDPVLTPTMHYENEGKAGVAYPCGAAVIGEELFVYYGGGDRVVCVATVPLKEFIEDVMKDIPVPFSVHSEAV